MLGSVDASTNTHEKEGPPPMPNVKTKHVKKKPSNPDKKKPTELPSRYEKGFIQKLDGRTNLAQLLSANRDTIIDDRGGEEELSHVQKGLIERYVFLEALLNQIEVEMANTPSKRNDLLGTWIHANNSLTGLAKTIGISRAKRVSKAWKSHGPTLEPDED